MTGYDVCVCVQRRYCVLAVRRIKSNYNQNYKKDGIDTVIDFKKMQVTMIPARTDKQEREPWYLDLPDCGTKRRRSSSECWVYLDVYAWHATKGVVSLEKVTVSCNATLGAKKKEMVSTKGTRTFHFFFVWVDQGNAANIYNAVPESNANAFIDFCSVENNQ